MADQLGGDAEGYAGYRRFIRRVRPVFGRFFDAPPVGPGAFAARAILAET